MNFLSCSTLSAVLAASILAQAQTPAQKPITEGSSKKAGPALDNRHIATGLEIPSEGYADQPYIVKTEDGAWLCAITTGTGHEGSGGQHVISMRSTDHGRSWEKPVDIEPADGVEASYVVLLKTPYGRIYALYNHNTDNVREVKQEGKGVYKMTTVGPGRQNAMIFPCGSSNVTETTSTEESFASFGM